MTSNTRVLITGSAGFIGSNLMQHLGSMNLEVLGLDNYSDYYSVGMKIFRNESLGIKDKIIKCDIRDKIKLQEIFLEFRPNVVVNLAAQGGVRASRIDPIPYLETNQIGFLNLFDASIKSGVDQFVFASSSSVYGDLLSAPFSETNSLPGVKSLYALSKISNELIAQNYPSPNMNICALRFFTVYGPWARPDMAMFRLLASSLLNEEFTLSASPDVVRDFTFVDDVSEVIRHLVTSPRSREKFRILNVAGGRPHSLQELFEVIESQGLPIRIRSVEADSLDMKLTHGSVDKLRLSGLPVPSTTLQEGVMKTVDWIKAMNVEHIREWFESPRYV